jgi:hypothetical protein
MRTLIVATVATLLVCSAVAALEPLPAPEASTKASTVVTDFSRLKSLAGEWIDVTGTSAGKGEIAAVYRVTSGGSVVQETLFPGSDHEMVSMYTAADGAIVMSHYCAMGNQPRMRAPIGNGNTLVFAFDGGVANPGKDMHMHNGLIRFDDGDRIYAEWQTWLDGKPGEHKAQFTLQRRTGG